MSPYLPRLGRPGGLLLLLALVFLAMAWLASRPATWYGFVAAAFAAGGVLLLLWRRGGFTTGQVLAWAVAFRLLFLWLPPGLSDDAYRYVWDGMVQVEGINPYRYTPEDPALAPHQDEPVFEALNSARFYSVYPPLSQLLFAVGGLFYGLGWQVSYYVIKLVLAGFEIGGLFLLARMVDARALMLYAWNPLVIVETAGQAHTEAAVVLFLVATIWFAGRRQPGAASIALACAGWVKLYPFVLFPFLWRRFGWRVVWPAAAASVLIVLPYAAPDVPRHIWASLDLYVRYFEFNAGFYYGLKKIYQLFTGEDWSKTLGPALRTLFLGTMVLLYALDRRAAWPLRRSFVLATGAFLLLATTVHPWYLLGLLPLVALAPAPPWHWLWLGLCSLGTYLLYVGGPYWTFVILGWAGFAVLAVLRYRDPVLQWIQEQRARRKFAFIRAFFPASADPLEVLDLGAGEGYVGRVIHRTLGADVMLADVLPLNRTGLPYLCYDGQHLPFPDDRFDVTVLYFVLHHCREQEQVVQEALRVSRRRVIVVESVYRGAWDRRLLTGIDRLANRWRSGGAMRAQEPHLRFRTVEGWEVLFARLGVPVLVRHRRGNVFHRQALFVLQAGRDDIAVIENDETR